MKRRLGVWLTMLGAVGCATEANVMLSPPRNWLAVEYAEDRSEAILKAQRATTQHCLKQGHKQVQLLSEVTVYQGSFDRTITEAARAAGRVASIYGNVEGSQAGDAFSSDTDYRTTIEFQCL